MRSCIEKRVRKLSSQGLCQGQVRDITVGNQQRRLNVEEAGERILQPVVEPVIARGRSRSRNVQSECREAFPRGALDLGMAGQPEIIAAAEVSKPFSQKR